MQIAPFNTAECGGTFVDHETAGYASTSARKKVRRGKGNKFYLILLLWKVEGWQRTTRRHALSWTSSSAPRCLHHAQPVADQTWREREGKGGREKKKTSNQRAQFYTFLLHDTDQYAVPTAFAKRLTTLDRR